MADPPQARPAVKKSRILAALDNPNGFLDLPGTQADAYDATDVALSAGVKRLIDSDADSDDEDIDGRGMKRRASGQGIRATDSRPAIIPASSTQFMQKLYASQPTPTPQPQPSSSQAGSNSKAGGFGSKLIGKLHYDTESPVGKIDVGGADQALRMADFVSKTIDNASHGLSVQAAMESLGLKDKRDVIPGLEVRLLPHQLIGVSWMVRQERHPEYRGGFLADDMGLGKTVQMIATMVYNLPTDEDRNTTTLIVVPAALLLQWKEELEQKTNDVFTVHIQHGKDKLRSLDQLRSKDVIITSFQTLSNDFQAPPSVEPEHVYEWALEHGGPLARMKWYRVVVDEAQFIRNRNTRASKALAMVQAKYRWCLTGTPVTNTLADIYGLLRFGHFRPFNDWYSFDEFIAKVQIKNAPLAGHRAQAVLQPIILRRTKNSTLEGKPILELPPKHVDLVRLEFSADERQLYEHMQRRAQLELNRYIKNGSVVKHHSQVLVLILRLRQLCCHPNLVLSLSSDGSDPALALASLAEKEFARATKAMGTKWAFNIKKQFLERAIEGLLDFDDEDLEVPEGECPVCGDPFINNNGLVLACGHEICFECCRELAAAPIAHNGIFGEGDERTNIERENEFEMATTKGLRPCPTCRKMNDLRSTATFKSAAFQPTPQELRDATRRRWHKPSRSAKPGSPPLFPVEDKKQTNFDDFELRELSDSEDEFPDTATILKKMKLSKGDANGKGKAKANGDDELTDITLADISGSISRPGVSNAHSQGKDGEPSDSMIRMWRQGGANVEPSTKMLALIGLIQEWEGTGDKVICFSQWTSMLDLVEMLFARYGIQSLRYDGTMDRAAREAVLARYRQPGGPRVILISMKCGGVGLNLTSANRVINLDLSWNYATESQAYDRVYRLGQEKEVFVKRLVVNNTLEERMLHLQDTKTGLAEAALGEGTGLKLHKLSVAELKDLFGMSRERDVEGQTRLSYVVEGQA
ncbi:SNF2 family N-terminal domain-containing protein [Irpex rosettiformis]|uniref:SNF2 family N-terminal domain-containing protein n=1 Tax=Irpex rosettiformis TaxID=378272 RepID=A0ACB8TVH2_9APHY|nr:SNF2 family N-terminal domain-containing protein [Irpex rosettiformis]